MMASGDSIYMSQSAQHDAPLTKTAAEHDVWHACWAQARAWPTSLARREPRYWRCCCCCCRASAGCDRLRVPAAVHEVRCDAAAAVRATSGPQPPANSSSSATRARMVSPGTAGKSCCGPRTAKLREDTLTEHTKHIAALSSQRLCTSTSHRHQPVSMQVNIGKSCRASKDDKTLLARLHCRFTAAAGC
jgi:hypothetical protein